MTVGGTVGRVDDVKIRALKLVGDLCKTTGEGARLVQFLGLVCEAAACGDWGPVDRYLRGVGR